MTERNASLACHVYRSGSPRTIPPAERTREVDAVLHRPRTDTLRGTRRLVDFSHRQGCRPSRSEPPWANEEGELDREAHVSAEDAQARARPWFPRAHEDDRGTQGPRGPSRAWTQTSHRRLAREWSTPHACGTPRTSRRSERTGSREATSTSAFALARTRSVSSGSLSRPLAISGRRSGGTARVGGCVRRSARSSVPAFRRPGWTS